MKAFRFVLSVLLFGTSVPVYAAVFPDVPNGHVHQESIEALVTAKVISGNPDGKFYPERSVNRAEMLKMLYLAKGKKPDPANHNCFPDVAGGSWYESYVCDAAANRYVNGYSDGAFRPGETVNRVEALKMITNVLGIPVEDITAEMREVVQFVDISVAAWYTPYIFTAYSTGILPIPGQDTSRFYPDWPLLRGEAAAMIFNALNVDLQLQRTQSSSSSSVSSITAAQSSSSSSVEEQDEQYDVSIPFDRSGKFNAKKPVLFRFDLSSNTALKTVVSLQAGQGSVSCRLYLLEEDGFSEEYYLGYQETGSCYLQTALKPGSYQLQIQPTVADSTYSVTVTEQTGDGNDGFRQASILPINTARTGILSSNDFQDWYVFTVPAEANYTVEVSSDVNCLVYVSNEVDLLGFEIPACNQSYRYPAGTYYVAVRRSAQKASQQTYSIILR